MINEDFYSKHIKRKLIVKISKMASGVNTLLNQRQLSVQTFAKVITIFSSSSRGKQCMTNSITFITKSYLKRHWGYWYSRKEHNFTFTVKWYLVHKALQWRQQHDLSNFQELPELIEYNGRCFTIRRQITYVVTISWEDGVDG